MKTRVNPQTRSTPARSIQPQPSRDDRNCTAQPCSNPINFSAQIGREFCVSSAIDGVLAEFRQSAIPDRLALANVEWIEGDAAIEVLTEHAIEQVQRVTSYATEPAKRILDRYEFARAGGWLAFGTTIDGGLSTVAYFKPDRPRPDLKKVGKFVKYESPQGCEALPILPCITWFDGLAIARKHNLEKEYEQRISTAFAEFASSASNRSRAVGFGVADETGHDGARGDRRDQTGEARQADRSSNRRQRDVHLDYIRECDPRFGQVDQGFWAWVRAENLPIAIVEGFKKALSLIAHGLPAIAIRGVTQWHKKGTNELHNAIAQFATAKRKIYAVFDEDAKAKTRSDVHQQRMKLGAALESCGCIVSLPLWDGSQLGKGIDDVLFGQGDRAQTWLDELLANAPSLKLLRQGDRLRKALEVLQRLSRLTHPLERHTEGEYLPRLPALARGAIHVLSASMDSGKTTRIGSDWVRDAIDRGWNILVLAPLNSLGEQTANNWGLPHIHNYGNSAEQQRLLWLEVSHSQGLVMCPDSLHRLPESFFDRPCLLVLDEANQVIHHTTQGDTLKSRWAQILERLTIAARRAVAEGAIVLSEDGLSDRAVNFAKAIAGGEVVRVFTHTKQGKPWDCTIYQGQASGYRAKAIAAAQAKRLLYVTTSQQDGKRLARALQERSPQRKVIRIDSETNQAGRFSGFFRDPDRWLETEQPDVLILSPSAKSGVSIQGGVSVEDAYFNEVWGYFPALATDSHMQLLGRYRPAVPRVVFCPNFIQSGADESLLYPSTIARQLQRNAKQLAAVYQLDELLTAGIDRLELMAAIEDATLNYLADAIAVLGAQKLMAHASLVSRIESAGHHVTSAKLAPDKSTVELWKQITEELWREDAATLAAATIDKQHTSDWARRSLESQDSSLQDRTTAQKVLLRDEFPGVAFNDAEECYQAICKNYGAMRRGVTLQAKAENLDAAKAIDRTAAEAVLSKNIRALHRLPRAAVRAVLIAKTGILALLDGSAYHNKNPKAIAVKSAALKLKNEIRYWLRLQVNETQTPVEVVNKLLKKLGLTGESIARPGVRGQQSDRHYQVSDWDDPIRTRLLEAVRCKLSESVSTTRNQQLIDLQIMDTGDRNPLSLTEWGAAESLADVREWHRTVLADPSNESIAQLLSSVPPDVLKRAIAS